MSDLDLYEQGVRERLLAVQDEVAQAARRSGRTVDTVQVIGVSKYVDTEHARLLARCGVTALAENRWQVAQPKVEANLPVAWHFIGPLQTNKAQKVAQYFSLVHTLDRVDLARALEGAAVRLQKSLRVLIQVNIAGEQQKSGVDPEHVDQLLENIMAYEHIQVQGLMMIGTQGSSESVARRQFETLRTLRDDLQVRSGRVLPELSMGMSSDFTLAIEEGATIVRIGRRLVLENC